MSDLLKSYVRFRIYELNSYKPGNGYIPKPIDNKDMSFSIYEKYLLVFIIETYWIMFKHTK